MYTLKHKDSKFIDFEVDDYSFFITPVMNDTGVKLTPIICENEGVFHDNLRQFAKNGWVKE